MSSLHNRAYFPTTDANVFHIEVAVVTSVGNLEVQTACGLKVSFSGSTVHMPVEWAEKIGVLCGRCAEA